MKIGDYVEANGRMDDINFAGEIGIVARIPGNGSHTCRVKFPERFNSNLHGGSGSDVTRCSYNIDPEFLNLVSEEEYQKMWGDAIKRKEEARLKHLEMDPYGEEEWEFENLKTFEEFNWNPFRKEKKMDSTLERVIERLEDNFDLNRFSYSEEENINVGSIEYIYKYKLDYFTILSILRRIPKTNSQRYNIHMAGVNMNSSYSKKLIRELYEFFKRKHRENYNEMKELEKNKRERYIIDHPEDPYGEEEWEN